MRHAAHSGRWTALGFGAFERRSTRALHGDGAFRVTWAAAAAAGRRRGWRPAGGEGGRRGAWAKRGGQLLLIVTEQRLVSALLRAAARTRCMAAGLFRLTPVALVAKRLQRH